MDVSEVTVLGCGHAVCGSCLEKWAKDEGGWPTLHAQQRYAHHLPAWTSSVREHHMQSLDELDRVDACLTGVGGVVTAAGLARCVPSVAGSEGTWVVLQSKACASS